MEEEAESIPYGKILLTPSIVGVCAGAIGDFLSIQVIMANIWALADFKILMIRWNSCFLH